MVSLLRCKGFKPNATKIIFFVSVMQLIHDHTLQKVMIDLLLIATPLWIVLHVTQTTLDTEDLFQVISTKKLRYFKYGENSEKVFFLEKE